MVYNSNFTRVKKELVAITDKVERLTMIQDHEHEIDVMALYFLSYYYSGDKDKLKAYLDNNDAKFTNPEVATVSSTMLEKVELVKNEKDTYEVTYVVGTTDEAQKTTVRRVTFNVKKKPSATQGWVVTSEPTTTAFATPTSPSTETSQLKTRRITYGCEATIEIEQGRSCIPSDMISQSKDWPNEVGSKGWGGDKDKELLLASFYAQWDQYLHPTTGVFIAFGFIPEMLSKGIYSFSYAIEKAYLNMFKLFGMFDYISQSDSFVGQVYKWLQIVGIALFVMVTLIRLIMAMAGAPFRYQSSSIIILVTFL
ncbi:MAG: hypothetical protein ACLS6Y_09200 [Streptococcus salivarius]